MKFPRGLRVAVFPLLALTAHLQCGTDMVAPPISPGVLTPTGSLGVIRAAHTAAGGAWRSSGGAARAIDRRRE